jgi:Asp-tRNA(Asn)/Glu-tRNA(Gln) amidotransferase A subunit family amidase
LRSLLTITRELPLAGFLITTVTNLKNRGRTLEDWRPPFDAAVVALARRAGAVVAFDTVGILAATGEDAALFVEAVTGCALVAAAQRAERPRVTGGCRSPAWAPATPAMRRAFESLPGPLEKAGVRIAEIELPPVAADALGAHERIMAYEAARALAFEADRHWESLSLELRDLLGRGAAMERAAYEREIQARVGLAAAVAAAFEQAEVLLSPSAPGTAPLLTDGSGDLAFSRIWSLAVTPCGNVPGLTDTDGLPLGVQIMGAVGQDAAGLEAAAWLERLLS